MFRIVGLLLLCWGKIVCIDRIPVGVILDESGKEFGSAFSLKNLDDDIDKDQGERKIPLLVVDKIVKEITNFNFGREFCSQLEKGIFALFGTHTIHTSEAVMSYASHFNIPYVTPSPPYDFNVSPQSYGLYMIPPYSDVIRALLDIVYHFGWERVHYFYDSAGASARIDELYKEITADGQTVQVDLYHVTSARDAFNTIKKLSTEKEDFRPIMLDLRDEECEELFKIAKTTAIMFDYEFLLVGLGIQTINFQGYDRFGGINVTGLGIVDYNSRLVKEFRKNWTTLPPKTWAGAGTEKLSYRAALGADSVSVIRKAMQTQKPDVVRKYLRRHHTFPDKNHTATTICETSTRFEYGPVLMQALKKVKLQGLTGNIEFNQYGLRKNFVLDVWRINNRLSLTKVGHWDSNNTLVIQRAPVAPPVTSRNNSTPIYKEEYIVTSILQSPYLMEHTKPNKDGSERKGNERYYGYCADLIKLIAESPGIIKSYTIVPVADSSSMFGERLKNGSWTGMVGELVEGRADLSVAPLTITSDRENAIDFSKPFMSVGISIMVKKVANDASGVFSFLYPLSSVIWMCIIFAYIGVSVVLFLVSRFSPFEWHIEDNTEGPTVTNNFSIFNSLWFCLAAFMQQGCDIEPRSTSGRVAGSVWWFFTLIIISSYTANLAAFLTTKRMISPVGSAEDLSRQTVIKYGMVRSGSTMEFFKTSTIPLHERMYAFMSNAEPSVFVETSKDGVEKVRSSDGKYAFLIESTNNIYENQQQPCNTMKVGDNLDSKGYGIGTRKGSGLREEISMAILVLAENGTLRGLEKKWWYEEGECGKVLSKSQKGSTSALKLHNVAGIFYILTCGLVSALAIALTEFLYKSKVEAQRHKTSFTSAMKSKATLSIHGKPEEQNEPKFIAPTQLITLEGMPNTDSSTPV